MNSSENLISLSDSGMGSSITASNTSRSGTGGAANVDLQSNGGGNQSGILIDLTDAVQGPVPQSIMMLAEVDDTFGIFTKAKECQKERNPVFKDDASKLVNSFTSGRKSNGSRAKGPGVNQVEENNEMEVSNQEGAEKKELDSSDSSEQATIVDPDDEEPLSPIAVPPDDREEEEGIMEEKMGGLSTLSGESDSDILDINNLSSFSIPDGDVDENSYLEEIKQEVKACSSSSAAIINRIKSELMHTDETNDDDLLSDMSRPTFRTSVNTTKAGSRLSTASSVISTSTRLSSVSYMHDDDVAPRSKTRPRLSGIIGSPIRASYPVSKYFMPTPKTKTPNQKNSLRDKLSESMHSPNMSRIIRTGDPNRSPSRVPVRKSISAETLHYSPGPDRMHNAFMYSTPSRSRHSYNFQSSGAEYNVNTDAGFAINNQSGVWNRQRENAVEFTSRVGRLSVASSASNTSIHTLSPTGSTTSTASRRDLSEVVRQLQQMRMNDTTSTTSSTRYTGAGKAGQTFVAVQPMKATAVIQPTNITFTEPAKVSEPKPIGNLNTTVSTSQSSGQRKFIPPIAASSPKTAPSPARARASPQTTPSRSRYSVSARSSGYGQQSLNSTLTFGGKPPLTSPNPRIPSTNASIKPPAIPKSLKSGLTFASKIEVGRTAGNTVKTTSVGSGLPAPKILKPTLSGASGLQRPNTRPLTTNKENIARAIGSKIGSSRLRQ